MRRACPMPLATGTFENNLKGQTAGEFLMGAGTALLWREDEELRQMVRAIVAEIDACRDEDGFLIPIPRDQFKTKEYPNYTRAWITFGLLDAGYAGEARAFELARGMSDYFNACDVLPYVKDLNLGFQGILANTRQYDAPDGKWADMQTAIDHYQETWWLEQVIAGDQRAIYDHPGNHPHSTLLTTLEGYCDLYRATGEDIYLRAVKSALQMYEDKWQHVGGGINMCEHDTFWPGCNWLSPSHNYNELCSTNFWVLLNQRMHRLEPDNAHYVDEMENSLYNVLFAAQVGSQGYHYLNFLERSKDTRYLDRATCCASLGTRLAGLLPPVPVYLYGGERKRRSVCPQRSEPAQRRIPARGNRHPRWRARGRARVGNAASLHAAPARAALVARGLHRPVRGDRKRQGGRCFCARFPPALTAPRVTPAAKKSLAKSVGRWSAAHCSMRPWARPRRCASGGIPGIRRIAFTPQPGSVRTLRLKGDNAHEYRAYTDIHDEPFSVYPIVEPRE